MEGVLSAVAAFLVGAVVLLVWWQRRAVGSGDRARRVQEALARAREKQRMIGERNEEERSGEAPPA